MGKPIISIDFDGVIHSYTSGWQGPRTIPDPPVPGALSFMLDRLNDERPWDVVIHSSRARYFGGISAMRAWLRKHAGSMWWESVGCYGLESVRFSRWKPAAVLTLDDRALTFTGAWPTLEQIKTFKPWNKR